LPDRGGRRSFDVSASQAQVRPHRQTKRISCPPGHSQVPMARKNTKAKFAELVHRSISDNVFRAIQADALATEIASRRSWINNMGHGRVFSTVQLVLADELVLSVTRMFDPPHPKYPTQRIPALLQFMEKRARWLPLHSRLPLERLLAAAGASPRDLRSARDRDLTRLAAAHYRARVPDPARSGILSTALRTLRFRRNKQIAHAQAVSPRKRARAAWNDARALLEWALTFADVIGAAYLDYYFLASDGRTYLADRQARAATRDLASVLDRAGLQRGRFRRRGAA